jgi:MFS family permease
MGEGRPSSPRERANESPAQEAGLSRYGQAAGILAGFRTLLRGPVISEASADSYRRERVSDITLSVAFGLMEGGVVGVIAAKVFGAHPSEIALISAAPMFGNLSSAFWARVGQHFRKVPLLIGLQLLLVIGVAAVALLPATLTGARLLVAIMIATRLVIGGMITIRSVVWTHNYPADVRARVISRLSFLAQLSMTLTAIAAGAYLGRHEERFGALYLFGAAVSLVGVFAYTRVRLRGEEQRGDTPIGGHARADATPNPGVVRILRDDPLFARYMLWQFVLGVSNMMIEPAVIYAVTNELHASYEWSITLTAVLPLGLGMATIPFWAGYVDRVHISEFRSRHSWIFVVSQAVVGLGIFVGSLPVLALGRSLLGVGRGGGTLAWQLGHNDFAHPERAGAYMGLHVTLTGLRGAFAPFLGMLLYVGMSERELFGVTLPAVPALGAYTMVLAAGLSTVAATGFLTLHRRITRERREALRDGPGPAG